MEALRQAKQSNYNCQWWIKADGWDVQMASESRPFGMVLCDGSLHTLYKSNQARCAILKGIGSSARSSMVSFALQ